MTIPTDQRRRARADVLVLLLIPLIVGLLGLMLFLGRDDSTEVDAGSDDTAEPAPGDGADEGGADEGGADEGGGSTIVDVAVADGRFGELVAAVQGAGLDEVLSGEGPFTVFAPTDEAFAAAAEALPEAFADPEVVAEVLSYHVVEGEVPAGEVVELDSVTTVQGEEIAVAVEADEVVLNGATRVTQTDVAADNGLIHVVDGVLLPPSLAGGAGDEGGADEGGGSTIVDVAVADGRFGELVAAVQGAGLDEVLSGEGPFTVFAPTDEAISAALAELGERAQDPEVLAEVLSYHVVGGEIMASQVVEATSLETVQGESVAVSIVGDQVVLDETAAITETDIAADNGVIHVIDRLLVPASLGLELSLNDLFALEPIQFDVGSAVIRAESLPTIDTAAEILSASSDTVVVEGHTDATGDPAANQALSEARAAAVVEALIERGVDADRLSSVGLGQEQPVADNETAEGRQANRRIEFDISG